jgi:transposase
MAGKIRKYHGDGFKFKVALAAIKGNKSVAEMVQEFAVAAGQISVWKKHLEENGSKIFTNKHNIENKDHALDQLYATIGRLTVDRDFLATRLERLK